MLLEKTAPCIIFVNEREPSSVLISAIATVCCSIAYSLPSELRRLLQRPSTKSCSLGVFTSGLAISGGLHCSILPHMSIPPVFRCSVMAFGAVFVVVLILIDRWIHCSRNFTQVCQCVVRAAYCISRLITLDVLQ